MLSWIADGFAQEFSGLNVFRYLSFRTLMALLTGLGAAFLMGRPLIRLLEAWQQHGQPIRSDGPETHHKKAGTPTMGGHHDFNGPWNLRSPVDGLEPTQGLVRPPCHLRLRRHWVFR